MAVAAARGDRIAAVADRLLDREDEPTTRTQRLLCRRDDRLQRSEVDERVRRDDHVESLGAVGEVRGQLTLDQLVVDAPFPGSSKHALGEVDADEAPRKRRE